MASPPSRPLPGNTATSTAGLSLHRAALVRLLTGQLAVGEPGGGDVAETLGQWLEIADAIALSSALSAAPPTSSPTSPSPTATAAGQGGALALAGEEASAALAAVELARAQLAELIERACQSSGEGRLQFPLPGPAMLAALLPALVGHETANSGAHTEHAAPSYHGSAYTPYHRLYLALQRELESRITPLRPALRHTLHGLGGAGRELAALDTAMDNVLAARERRLLGQVPLLLEDRFRHLWQSYGGPLPELGAEDREMADPARCAALTAPWLAPGGWLARFRDELQQTLLAELELRLLPLQGMVDALRHDLSTLVDS